MEKSLRQNRKAVKTYETECLSLDLHILQPVGQSFSESGYLKMAVTVVGMLFAAILFISCCFNTYDTAGQGTKLAAASLLLYINILFSVDASGKILYTGEVTEIIFFSAFYLIYLLYILPQRCPVKKKLSLAGFVLFPGRCTKTHQQAEAPTDHSHVPQGARN